MKKSLSYEIITPEKKEQERTRIRKQMFIQYFQKHFGIISKVCNDIGIERSTYYGWRKDDPEFAKKIREVEGERNDAVEDVLFLLIAQEDGPSVRFYLERRNPAYKQKTVNEVIPGDRTLEDLLDEFKNKDDELSKQQNIDSKPPQDSQQAGIASTVPIQHSPTVLLGTENAPQPDGQGPPKGA
jgi:hypothetical protein